MAVSLTGPPIRYRRVQSIQTVRNEAAYGRTSFETSLSRVF